ncbi:hypothetical protein [Haloterrigena salinisoli]|uniref:hypothetical protein n=1 Tax=Haloterrigena salinisoli TaxID=3132747 RepID=UPI0030D5AFA4
MSEEFVSASELYDVESRTPIVHPAHQATDADVRRALENREIRADGGNASSVNCRALIVVLVVGIRVVLCVLFIAIGTRTEPRFWFFIYLLFRSVKAFFIGIL